MFANLIRVEGGGAKKTPMTKHLMKNMKSCENAPKVFFYNPQTNRELNFGGFDFRIKIKTFITQQK